MLTSGITKPADFWSKRLFLLEWHNVFTWEDFKICLAANAQTHMGFLLDCYSF